MNNADSLSILETIIKSRRSVRRFKPDPVPRDLIRRAVDLAGWAPSASRRQDWLFTIIESPSIKNRFAQIVIDGWKTLEKQIDSQALSESLTQYSHSFSWFENAPAIIIVSAKQPESFLKAILNESAERVSGALASAAMAAQNFMLAAHALGLGTCCLTGPLIAEESLADIIDWDRRRQVVCLIAIGYPDHCPLAPGRKPVDNIMRFIE